MSSSNTALDLSVRKALLYLTKYNRNINLKEEQQKAIYELLRGKDVLAVLPTGFGKSMIFTVFGLAKSFGRDSEFINSEESTVVVISPLKSLISDQLAELESIDCSATELSGETLQQIVENPPCFVYATAEQALEDRFLKAVKDPKGKLHQKISLIVVDESHTVETWSGKR